MCGQRRVGRRGPSARRCRRSRRRRQCGDRAAHQRLQRRELCFDVETMGQTVQSQGRQRRTVSARRSNTATPVVLCIERSRMMSTKKPGLSARLELLILQAILEPHGEECQIAEAVQLESYKITRKPACSAFAHLGFLRDCSRMNSERYSREANEDNGQRFVTSLRRHSISGGRAVVKVDWVMNSCERAIHQRVAGG
jgi:hypothetical protein